MLFMNTVKARLISGFAIILASLLAVSVVSILRLSQAARAAQHVEDVVLPTQAANEHVALLMQRYRTLEYAHLGALVPEDHPAIETLMGTLDASLKSEFERLAAHPDLQEASAGGVPQSWRSYAAYFDESIKRDSHDGMANIAIRRMAGEHEQQFNDLMNSLDANSRHLKAVVTASTQASEAMRRQTQNAIVVGSALAMLIGGVIAVFTLRQITHPLNRIISFANDIAHGNLAARLDGRAQGEMQMLVQALQTMKERLGELVRQTRDGVSQVQQASGEIAASGMDLSSRTEQQAQHVTAAASTLTDLTEVIRCAATAAGSAQQLAKGSVDQAKHTGQLMHKVIEGMAGITQTTMRISEIVQTIDGIAFQTNILALNAAVEAACAGEHGRGFAVVASEVRALAQRCAAAAKDIRDLSADARERVQQGEGSTRSANEAVSGIVTQINEVADFIDQMSSQSIQQLEKVEYVHQSVLVIDDMTQHNAALSEQSAAAASSLRDQADALSRSVCVFRLNQA